MPITVEETPTSRQSTHGNVITFRYLCKGSSDEAAIIAAVVAEAPTDYTFVVDGDNVTVPQAPIKLEPLWADTETSTGHWLATVPYQDTGAAPYPPQAGEVDEGFDILTQTRHITQSINHVQSYDSSGTLGDPHSGAIGWDGENNVGTDILEPIFRFTKRGYLEQATVTPSFQGDLMDLVSRINDDTFFGFAAGQVMLIGVAGKLRARTSTALWEMTYSFAASKNRTNLVIGKAPNQITVAVKGGWHYLWVEYQTTVDGANNRLVAPPIAAHVEQVYRDGDFSLLGIGTS
jgi:hypothetical protein